MNKSGNKVIGKSGKQVAQQSVRTLLLIALMFQFPNALFSQVAPLSAEGNKYFDAQQYDSALINFNQLLELYPETKELYFNRGLCYFKMDSLDAADNDFKKCLEMDSQFTRARVMKASILERRGHIQSAMREYVQLEDANTSKYLLNNRIKHQLLAVWISNNWYYMVAIMIVLLILMGIAAKSLSYKKW